MTLATDPWWEGPCYARQWNVFPRPVAAHRVDDASHILLSHGHADHLNEPTLATLSPGKTALYPFYWYGGTIEWLRSMPFGKVIEATSGTSYALGGGVKVTYLVCGQDAVMVIEDGTSVVVNVNDALHSTSADIIALYCSMIRKRWPKIDAVFCGFGGASYFPNVFHTPGKDNRAVGALREEFFAGEFCRIVAALEPTVAIPFAADFVLLSPDQRWVNDVRFPREAMGAYFDQHFRKPGCTTRIVTMYPGDVLENSEVLPLSPYRDQLVDGSLDHLIDEQYPAEVSVFASGRTIDAAEAEALTALLERHLPTQTRFYPVGAVEGLTFAVELTDVEGARWFNARVTAATATVERAEEPAADAIARIRTSHDALVNSVTDDWGGDDIIIGYGCQID